MAGSECTVEVIGTPSCWGYEHHDLQPPARIPLASNRPSLHWRPLWVLRIIGVPGVERQRQGVHWHGTKQTLTAEEFMCARSCGWCETCADTHGAQRRARWHLAQRERHTRCDMRGAVCPRHVHRHHLTEKTRGVTDVCTAVAQQTWRQLAWWDACACSSHPRRDHTRRDTRVHARHGEEPASTLHRGHGCATKVSLSPVCGVTRSSEESAGTTHDRLHTCASTEMPAPCAGAFVS